MNPFLKGLFIGTAAGVLIAPMKGVELRRLVQHRLKGVGTSLSENEQLQQVSQQAVQSAHALTQSVANISRANTTGETASPVETIKQVAATVQQNAQQVAATVQQNTQQVASSVQQTAQNLTSSVQTAATEKISAIKPLNTLLQNKQELNPEIHSQLEALGIHTTDELLERTATQKQRAELALQLNTSASELKSYAIQADLMRISGINAGTAQLLEAAGVTSSQDFQRRNPENLHTHLEESQATAGQKVPTVEQLTQWIASA